MISFLLGAISGVTAFYVYFLIEVYFENKRRMEANEKARMEKLESLQVCAESDSSVNYATFHRGKLDVRI